MSWTIIKDLKEKRAVAYAAATTIREAAHKESRDLTADEETRHAGFLTEVESFNKRLEREEKAGQIGEFIESHNRSLIGRENSVEMPQKDFRRYSLMRALRAKLGGKELDGVEAEVNAELAKRMGRNPTGFFMPYDKVARRSLNAASTGVGSIETTTESTFIDVLRAKTVTGKIGTTFLTGLQGKIAIPQKTAAAAAYWVGEGGSPTAGQPTLSQVLFTPHTLGGYTDITRQFVEQTSLDAEAFVMDDLTKSLGVSLDVAAFVGTGTSNQPLGIVPALIAAAGSNYIALATNGADPTFANMVNMETQVANNNADLGDMSYVVTPAARGYLKVTPKNSSAVAAGFIYEDNEINGYTAYATNVLPSNGTKGSGTNLSTAVFGNFNDLVIGMWGGLDIIVDPYTGSSAGTVRIVALQDCDIEQRHLGSFSAITDMQTV